MKEWSLISLAEASRAKHKFAVKRNSWPKTRGVAMNPVDHPHGGVSFGWPQVRQECTLTHPRVTINISERHPPCRDTPSRDKRPVLLLLAELVCSAVPRRSRIKRWAVGISFTFGQAGFALCTFNGAQRGRNKDFKNDDLVFTRSDQVGTSIWSSILDADCDEVVGPRDTTGVPWTGRTVQCVNDIQV